MHNYPVVSLDIGVSKVVCLVGELQDNNQLKILGLGKSPCHGMRRGIVIDMPRVVEAIRSAVGQAERSSGLKITGAYVGIAGESIEVQSSRSTIAISGNSTPIDEADIQRALEAADQNQPSDGAEVLHRFVQSYAIDGEPVQNPRWLCGNKLSIETLTISASSQACSTLRRAALEAGVEIAGFVLESVALSAVLTNTDEREMGIGILDIGAGSSDLTLFHGPLRHTVEIPYGGDDITKDLSIVLKMSPRESEKLKHEYGAVLLEGEQGDESLSIRTTAGRTNTITREQLCEIIEARQQEILEFARKALEQHPYGQMIAAGLILTGGGAQLTNLADLGEEILGMPVRLGAPQNLVTSEETANNLANATAIGLLRFSLDSKDQEDCILGEIPTNTGGGFKEKLTRFFVSFF